jgi:hypothetical protein
MCIGQAQGQNKPLSSITLIPHWKYQFCDLLYPGLLSIVVMHVYTHEHMHVYVSEHNTCEHR